MCPPLFSKLQENANMTKNLLKTLGVIASVSLFGACTSLDANTTRDGTPCTRDSEDDDCSSYVQYQDLEQGFKDQGFDEAHRKQGYENLREERRQRREQSTTSIPQPAPNTTGQPPADIDPPLR